MKDWKQWCNSQAAWYDSNLLSVKISIGDDSTMAYATPGGNDKPLALLVHGFSGDHSGLVFLARELVDKYRIVLIDLPWHGRSSLFEKKTNDDIDDVVVRVTQAVQDLFGSIDLIIGHSLGCGIVSMMTSQLPYAKTVLLCPVWTPSTEYKFLNWMVQRSRLVARAQNSRTISPVLGLFLLRQRTKPAFYRMLRDSLYQYRPDKDVVFRRKHLLNFVFQHCATTTFSPTVVIAGTKDKTARERDQHSIEEKFPGATVIMIPGGHLLPIESPELIAQSIIQNI